ncbi:hypothetical protein BKA70DRAFT_765575 [Coprinopsis sp. MPI-PUGE-AT-0042]|nr:hypothetical protein BKA70DRAFT_765575 [Coprinopsis sp. MPI-PUGE-AT-0042]
MLYLQEGLAIFTCILSSTRSLYPTFLDFVSSCINQRPKGQAQHRLMTLHKLLLHVPYSSGGHLNSRTCTIYLTVHNLYGFDKCIESLFVLKEGLFGILLDVGISAPGISEYSLELTFASCPTRFCEKKCSDPGRTRGLSCSWTQTGHVHHTNKICIYPSTLQAQVPQRGRSGNSSPSRRYTREKTRCS